MSNNKKDYKNDEENINHYINRDEEYELDGKTKLLQYVITFAICVVLTIALSLIYILIRETRDLEAFATASTVVTAVMIASGWLMFVYNKNLFGAVIHGFGSFVNLLSGKPRKTFYDYVQDRKVIPSRIIKATFIYSFFMAIITAILYIVLYV